MAIRGIHCAMHSNFFVTAAFERTCALLVRVGARKKGTGAVRVGVSGGGVHSSLLAWVVSLHVALSPRSGGGDDTAALSLALSETASSKVEAASLHLHMHCHRHPFSSAKHSHRSCTKGANQQIGSACHIACQGVVDPQTRLSFRPSNGVGVRPLNSTHFCRHPHVLPQAPR